MIQVELMLSFNEKTAKRDKHPCHRNDRLLYHDVHVTLGTGLIVTLQREGVTLNVLGSNDFQDLWKERNPVLDVGHC